MSVGFPTAGTWSSSQWRPDNEFETHSVARVRADRERLKQLVADPTLDLAQPVPTGEAHQTYLSTPPSIVCYIPNLLGGAASFRQSRYVWAST